ncbi:MAG: RNA-binding protein [Verrucomicrobiae bacterium]|nr:RNA-binding protein [Verrucomicrobiae bacterium]
MGKRLFVGNLSFHTTDSTLQSHFSQAGAVVSVDLVTDKVTGRSRGFAFVEMGTDDEARKAIEMFDGKDLDERSLKVNEARPREERPSGMGGGGPRRGGFRPHSRG